MAMLLVRILPDDPRALAAQRYSSEPVPVNAMSERETSVESCGPLSVGREAANRVTASQPSQPSLSCLHPLSLAHLSCRVRR